MSNRDGRGLLRRVFDNIIEARSREARVLVQHHIARYEDVIARSRLK